MGSVVLLNADFTFMATISIKRAFTLLVKAKVDVLEYTNKVVHGICESWLAPKILKLVKLVRTIYKTMVPWSTKNVIIRDNFKCQYCGCKLIVKNAECEHIVPKSRGGKSTFENTVCACHNCNQKKANRTPNEAGMHLLRRPYQPTIMEFIQLRLKNSGANDILKEFYGK